MKKEYVADDGTKFENEDECIEYELKLKWSINEFIFLDYDESIVKGKDFGDRINQSMYVFVPDYVDIEDFVDFMYDYYGMSAPTTTGWSVYDDYTDEWDSFEDKIEELQEEIDTYKRIQNKFKAE